MRSSACLRWLALLVPVLLCGCRARPRSGSFASKGHVSTAHGEVIEVNLASGAPESLGSGGILFQLPASRTYVGLVRALERARKDDDVTGVFVGLGTAELGWARSEELGHLLHQLGKQGKPVVCHADSLTNSSTWLLAAGCDRIWLSPAAEVDTVGIAAQMVYLKGALDKLKVQTDFIHMGKYKSAAEPITREGPSEPARISLTETLASIRKAWLDGIAASRKKKGIRDAMEHGPWSSGEAKDHGLVDAIGYESDAIKDAEKRGKADELTPVFGPQAAGRGLDLAQLIRVLAGADQRSGGRPHIAVLPADGEITMEPGGMLSRGGISAKAIIKTLRRLEKDDSVKVVVLRIDSPGGSALASDLIWHELIELKKKKPLVVSVGDMAASGGYYMACAATRIVAEPTSIVGSIGVLGGKVALAPALAQFGINSYTFPASKAPGAAARSAYESALTPWDDATRERVREQMKRIYGLFLRRVAAGRKMKVAEVQKIAQGRIWTAAQAKSRGLVDDFGGLDRALSVARQLAHLDKRAPVTVEGASESLLERLMLGRHADARAVAEAVEREQARRAPLVRLLPRELRPFAASLSPMLSGEHVLAAMPYAVVIR